MTGGPLQVGGHVPQVGGGEGGHERALEIFFIFLFKLIGKDKREGLF